MSQKLSLSRGPCWPGRTGAQNTQPCFQQVAKRRYRAHLTLPKVVLTSAAHREEEQSWGPDGGTPAVPVSLGHRLLVAREGTPPSR